MSTQSADLAVALDTAWGDPNDWIAEGLHWTHLAAIQRRNHRRVTGDESVAAIDWFFRQVAAERALPLDRVLVLGCGMALVEHQLVRMGWARQVIAMDLSARALDTARAATEEAKLDGITYVQADLNALPLGAGEFQRGTFDAVLGISGVHHCAELERLYDALGDLLVQDGFLYLDEYVGPSRFQYTPYQVRTINRLLQQLPDRLVTNGRGVLKRSFRAPTPDEVIAADPSEAVRSADLLQALDRRFRVVRHRGYGGAILHPLLAQIAQNFDETAQPYLQALLLAEDEMQRAGEITDDFAVVIARPR